MKDTYEGALAAAENHLKVHNYTIQTLDCCQNCHKSISDPEEELQCSVIDRLVMNHSVSYIDPLGKCNLYERKVETS